MLKNAKIYIPSNSIGTEVQKALFAKGHTWRDGSQHLSRNIDYLFIDEEGYLYRNDEILYFRNSPRTGTPYEDVLGHFLYVKLAWSRGETVQRVVQTDEGERWVDWEDSFSLDLNTGIDWRIKPNTKTFKQWERKYLKGDAVHTAISKSENIWEAGRNWITEPKQVVYVAEVVSF